MNTQRPLPVTGAAILLALFSLASLPLPLLPGQKKYRLWSSMGVRY